VVSRSMWSPARCVSRCGRFPPLSRSIPSISCSISYSRHRFPPISPDSPRFPPNFPASSLGGRPNPLSRRPDERGDALFSWACA
jgi:hypothetical protein